MFAFFVREDVLKQHLAALGNVILTNPKTDQTATIIEFRKKRNEINVDSWQAFVTLLQNAFGEALPESIPK